MAYTPEKLRPFLPSLTSASCWWVAYSGGCDSQALLHSVVRLALPNATIKAVHIDHGLQAASAQWAAQCVEWARALGVECRVIKVNAQAENGASPEEAARQARYAALRGVMTEGDVLLTAHHADDQAETVMLQMLRGGGAAGLAAMGESVSFGKGRLCRPLLSFTRGELEDYARACQLSWIDDPTNALTHYDRNYLRHRIAPAIAQRWPSWQRILGRVARHQAEAAQLADDLAVTDLLQTRVADSTNLAIDKVLELADYRQRNVLRYWLRQLDLPLPTSHQLGEIQRSLLAVGADRTPCVQWRGAQVRRYRNVLYAMSPLPAHDSAWRGCWDARTQSEFQTPTGKLRVAQLMAQDMLREDIDKGPFDVAFRQGGEKIRLKGRVMHHDLKHLFQEAGVPPWLRDRIPLLCRDGVLRLVYGYWLGE